MKYELAKQLKDAGFPLKQAGSGMQIIDSALVREKFEIDGPGIFHYEPTLSELIEACGDSFISLIKPPIISHWEAYAQTETETTDAVGETPEEAVAKLWLALNSQNGLQQDAKNQNRPAR